MNITVNGTRQPLSAGTTLLDLVAATTGRRLTSEGRPDDGGRLGVAVALNAEVAPRTSWAGTMLADGDGVELITAVQGG
ncbi:thiamine biosynthesis protein ThiS [Arthrobacter crystallopoietes BAB-32]|uniref:Thiamine biosynthesis protein ThiS n=1 Tax=Arthrobacter crystallopoietes BAB-32 TaxID=1246476 RepID=N1UZ37_9MICC|nr:sulfur carrier protein ThiS [Arthrobacter crystallopoietes]EMY33097.1 thiamine biosynthesis protein ThiS [Arthrobacter crystallopoietes BAB-32]